MSFSVTSKMNTTTTIRMNFSTTTSPEDCTWINRFAYNELLWGAFLFKLISLSTSFLIYTLFIFISGFSMGLHKNANILLICAHFFTMIFICFAFATVLNEIIRLYPKELPQNLCDLKKPIIDWVPMMIPNYFGYYGMLFSNYIMFIERLIATFLYKKYEYMNYMLGVVLFAVQIFMSALITYINFVGPFLDKFYTFTNLRVVVISAYNIDTFTWTNMVLIVSKTFIIVLLHILLYINRAKRKKMSKSESISRKYQIQENIRAIQLILPMVYVHYISFLPSLVNILVPILNNHNPQLSKFGAFVYEMGDTVVLYPTLLPLVLLKTNPDLQKRFCTFFRLKRTDHRNIRIINRNKVGSQTDHFNQLKSYWDSVKK